MKIARWVLIATLSAASACAELVEHQKMVWRYPFPWVAEIDGAIVPIKADERIHFRLTELNEEMQFVTGYLEDGKTIKFSCPPNIRISRTVWGDYERGENVEREVWQYLFQKKIEEGRKSLDRLREESEAREEKERIAEKRLKAEEQAENLARETERAERAARLIESWPPDIQEAIKAKKPKLGMTLDQVSACWGEPASAWKTTDESGITTHAIFENGAVEFKDGSAVRFMEAIPAHAQ